jgi:hypothetical protein
MGLVAGVTSACPGEGEPPNCAGYSECSTCAADDACSFCLETNLCITDEQPCPGDRAQMPDMCTE